MIDSPQASRPARSLGGVRRVVWLLAALSLVAVPAVAGIEKLEGPPPWRIGGRVGFTLDAAARPDSAGMVLDVWMRIPPATLRQLNRDEQGVAHLQADLRVKGRFGAKVAQTSRVFDLPELAADGEQGRVLLLRFPAAPGACAVQAKLTDLLSRKPGLLHNRNDHEEGGVSGAFEVPRPQNGRDLSDIMFLWPGGDSSSASAAFTRAGRTLVPNPERLYGLFAEHVRASFVARGKPGDTRQWHWVARVFDGAGQGVAQRESTAAAAALLDADVEFDMAGEPAGGYDLEIRAWQDGDAAALTRRERFSLGWQPETWLRNAADANDEVHFLLQADAEEDFVRMQPGEQEAFLEQFWRRRDPTPGTALNEALETFRERIRHANDAFHRPGIERGMFSDMGRVYVRYGEPTEILRQVIPAGDATLSRQLQELIYTEDRQPTDVAQKGLGGDMRPFEVWVYEGDIPLPPDADPNEQVRGRQRRRLLFLFVDDQGTGLFRLRYSTE